MFKNWLMILMALISGGMVEDIRAELELTRLQSGVPVYAGAIQYHNPDYDSLVLLEIPFSVNRHDFEFFQQDSISHQLAARIYAQFNLIDEKGYVIDSARTYFSVLANSEAEAKDKKSRIFNRLTLIVKPGKYTGRLTVIDVVSKKDGEFFLADIEVAPTQRHKLKVDGLQTAYDLKYLGPEAEKKYPHNSKNGFYIVTNPVNIFSDDDSVIYLYGEIYNLDNIGQATEYLLGVEVLTKTTEPYRNLGFSRRKKPGSTTVISQKIELAGFPTDNYTLRIVASSLKGEIADTAYLPFHIVSPQEIVMMYETRMKQASLQDAYDSLSLKDKENLVRYLLTENERKTLAGLNDEGKVNFLSQYWREHDPDKSTEINELRTEIIGRYFYANKLFSSNVAQTDGWFSDRGRIYLTYGPWDERDDFSAPRVGNAYEIWHYRAIKEGKFFVFEDWSGNSDYRLVHSNVYGEIYDKNWEARISGGTNEFFE